MRLDKLVNVPIDHPVRHHREVRIVHCHSQQRKHVRVTEGSPGYNLLTKPLCNHNQLIDTDF